MFDERLIAVMSEVEKANVLDQGAAEIARELERDDLRSHEGYVPASTVTPWIENLLDKAIALGASDIHLDPIEDGWGRVRCAIWQLRRDLF